MDERSDMAVFVTVVGEASFAGAAKALGMTPSGVSRRIGRIEDRLGVRLLNRTTRRLSLTEPGEIYYRRSAQIVADIEEAERETAQQHATPRGRLRVTASNAFGHQEVVSVMPEFLRRYPEVSVELRLTDAVVDLVAEGIDIAIRSGSLEDSSIISRRLASTRRVVCAAPAYLEAHGVPRRPEDLLTHNCLVRHNQRQFFNDWTFEGPDGERTVRVDGNLTSNSMEALYSATLAGVGILRVSVFVVDEAICDGRLLPLLEDYERIDDTPIYAVYPSNRHLSPKTRAFIDFLTASLADF